MEINPDLFFILVAAAGALTASAIIYTGWVIAGLRLKLYLVSRESAFVDQSLIPITSEARNRNLGALWKGLWHEDIDFSLGDHDGHLHHFKIDYHLHKRFLLTLTEPSPTAKLNGRELDPTQAASIHTGDRLNLAGREFHVLISPNLQREQRTFARTSKITPKKRDRRNQRRSA